MLFASLSDRETGELVSSPHSATQFYMLASQPTDQQVSLRLETLSGAHFTLWPVRSLFGGPKDWGLALQYQNITQKLFHPNADTHILTMLSIRTPTKLK